MTLRELVARNVSAALREVANAEMAAKHSKDGEVSSTIIEDIKGARLILEVAAKELSASGLGNQPLP